MEAVSFGYYFRHVLYQLSTAVAFYIIYHLRTLKYDKFLLHCPYWQIEPIGFNIILLFYMPVNVGLLMLVAGCDGLPPIYITTTLAYLVALVRLWGEFDQRHAEMRRARSVLYMESRYGIERDRLYDALRSVNLMQFPLHHLWDELGPGSKLTNSPSLSTRVNEFMTKWYQLVEGHKETTAKLEEYRKKDVVWEKGFPV